VRVCAIMGLIATFLGVSTLSHAAKTLTDSDLEAGKLPAYGDTIILSDFTRCRPRSAVSAASEKGKWWLRPYETASGAGKMLCVQERDMDDPQSCIAPPLTYPLNLKGTYDIWVATYRPVFGGGIDVKLTRDKAYTCINPWEEEINQWPPPADKVGRLVECFYKTAQVDGQDIQFRQPFGTYQSLWWGLCNAHIAYIKLIRRLPSKVQHDEARLSKMPHKGVVFDRDGFSHIWNWGTEDIDCVLNQVESLGYGNVEALNWCIGGSLATNFPHPMTDGRIVTLARLGDKRATAVYKSFEDRGIDILKVLVDRCHELGIKIYASHRANVHYYRNNVWDKHPDWRLKSGGGLDYANPEARAFYRDFLLYIPEHYDVDGITIDFTRHRRHFNPGQEDQFRHMNTYLRELRAGLDKIGAQKGKHLVLNASFTCGTWYDSWSPAQQGLDVETWVNEGIVDCIMPVGRDVPKYIKMCLGKKTKCYPRLTEAMSFDGTALASGLHDPTPAEDKKDRPDLPRYGPLQKIKGILDWYDQGADGVMLFNMNDAWTTLRHLPYPDLLRKELASGRPFGRHEGEAVKWLK